MRILGISIYLYLGRFILQVKSERNIQGGGNGVPWVHIALFHLLGGGGGNGVCRVAELPSPPPPPRQVQDKKGIEDQRRMGREQPGAL